MYAVEQTLRQALAESGVSLRSALIARHPTIPGFRALVCCCEGHAPCFSVYSSDHELRTEDWRWWVNTYCEPCLAATGNGAAMADGDAAGAMGDRVEC